MIFGVINELKTVSFEDEYMDYEKSDLDHAPILFYCPACNHAMTRHACDLEKNPQAVCPACGCLFDAEVEERKERLHNFYEQVKKVKNGDI